MNLTNHDDSFYVAGHKGMAGSAICRALLKNGYKKILKASREELNLEDGNQVEEWMTRNKPNIVIIAAARVGGIHANNQFPVDFLLSNLKIQNNLIESSFKNNVKRLLFLGSSCIYPKYANQPIKEESLLTGLLEPTNESYAIAKIAGLKLCSSYKKQYGFDAISLMPTNLYGPGDNYNQNNSHVLPAFIRRFHEAKEKNLTTVKCWGSGKARREFLHVDDLGQACIFALEKWKPSKEDIQYLNVGTGVDLTIKELAEVTAKTCGYNGKIEWDTTKPDGTPKKQLDVTLIQKLGWTHKIKLEDGLIETVKEFKTGLEKNIIRQ